MRRFALVLFGSLAMVSQAAAQDGGIPSGSAEIGIIGRYNKWADAYKTHGGTIDYVGIGGRLGYFVARKIATHRARQGTVDPRVRANRTASQNSPLALFDSMRRTTGTPGQGARDA